jgi:hypothetical protein
MKLVVKVFWKDQPCADFLFVEIGLKASKNKHGS